MAAQNTTQESSNSKNSSGSIGVGFQLGAGGSKAGVTVSASVGKGQGAGNSTTYTNSQVAGNTVNIESRGDTTIKGGVVKGNQVTANVGGNLNIESLQGKSQYNEKSQQVGGSATFGPAAGGSVNVASTKINSDYLSVGEQSAIRAGDGGFNIKVQDKTNLTGGQITSTQAAIDNNQNSFSSAGGVNTTDLQNSAKYSANSVSVGVGAGASAPGAALSTSMSGVGFGSDKGSAQSTTTAGISGVAGNTAARTGDKETGLTQIFDKDKTQKEVAAQVAITSEFGKQASKAVGDYAKTQYDKALAEKDQAGIDAWKEGGTNRVALHAVVGGLTGGAAGAVGATASSAAAPALDELQGQLQQGLQKAGLGEDASKLIASLASGTTAAGIGAAASGGSVAGGATAFNADMNNRQLHPSEKNLLKTKASEFAEKLKKEGYTSMTEERALAILTEQADNRIDETQAKRLDTASMDDALKAQAQKYLNQLGGSAGTYDDGRGKQIRYFTNTTASGERRIEDYKNPNINAEPHVPGIDYVTVQGGAFGKSTGVTVNVLDGTVLVGAGAAPNFGGVSPGASIVGGKMLGGSTDLPNRANEVNDTLRGGSATATVCVGGICGGVNQSIGPVGSNPPTAIELGFGTPGVSIGVGAGTDVGKLRKGEK